MGTAAIGVTPLLKMDMAALLAVNIVWMWIHSTALETKGLPSAEVRELITLRDFSGNVTGQSNLIAH